MLNSDYITESMGKYLNEQIKEAEDDFKLNNNYCEYCNHSRKEHYRTIQCRCMCNPCHTDECDCNLFTDNPNRTWTKWWMK